MSLPEPVRMIVTGSVTHVILLSAAIIVIALLATLKIPEVPMRSFSPPKEGPPPEAHL
jgi:hypothetical protein